MLGRFTAEEIADSIEDGRISSPASSAASATSSTRGFHGSRQSAVGSRRSRGLFTTAACRLPTALRQFTVFRAGQVEREGGDVDREQLALVVLHLVGADHDARRRSRAGSRWYRRSSRPASAPAACRRRRRRAPLRCAPLASVIRQWRDTELHDRPCRDWRSRSGRPRRSGPPRARTRNSTKVGSTVTLISRVVAWYMLTASRSAPGIMPGRARGVNARRSVRLRACQIQRRLQILPEVLDVLEPDRKPEQALRDPLLEPRLLGEPLVRRGRGMGDQALGVAEIVGDADHARAR